MHQDGSHTVFYNINFGNGILSFRCILLVTKTNSSIMCEGITQRCENQEVGTIVGYLRGCQYLILPEERGSFFIIFRGS